MRDLKVELLLYLIKQFLLLLNTTAENRKRCFPDGLLCIYNLACEVAVFKIGGSLGQMFILGACVAVGEGAAACEIMPRHPHPGGWRLLYEGTVVYLHKGMARNPL